MARLSFFDRAGRSRTTVLGGLFADIREAARQESDGTMHSVDVIVSGHLCLDLIPQMDSVPLAELASPGRMFETGPLAISTGGAVSNTGLALHKLGVPVGLMASVGSDLLGELIIAFLNSRDPALSELITVMRGQGSSYTVVMSPEKADRIFFHYPGTNHEFGVDDVQYSLLTEAKIFHMGYPPILPRLLSNEGEGLAHMYRRAKEAGVITSLDMTLPDLLGPSGRVDWRSVLARTLPQVDIFVPSLEETLFMLRREIYNRGAAYWRSILSADLLGSITDELLTMGAAIAGLKLGDRGIYLKTADTDRVRRLMRLPIDVDQWAGISVWHPAFAVEVAGTTGAGDSAYAGLLAALLNGFAPEQAARWACAVGACNVETFDATSGVRTWLETEQRLERGWAVREELIPGF